MASSLIPAEYTNFLAGLKERIRSARVRAALSVNRELILLYWEIGREILTRQASQKWGAKVIDRLAEDLRREFPDMKGLSKSNLKYMTAFAAAWPEGSIGQQPAGQLPWFHNILLITRLKDTPTREWYARAAIEHGWSRAILEAQIETGAHRRQGKAITNFERTLPAPQSELAQQVLKDPYSFDFLTLHDEAVERDLERGLLEHLREFMVQLGVGFAFVGSQVPLQVDGDDFYLDLLFYHLKLRCFVVIDLKMTAFKPEYAGKLNFYLSALDAQMRHPDDKPSIGILMCKGRKELVVEYALKDVNKPLGIAQYELAESLPKQLQGALPTVEQLEEELKRRAGKKPKLVATGRK
jgi:predicted nuclease of restriction endonuclease-like (RecB) superfamily